MNLHLELAKADIQNDNLVLAEQQIIKALMLDYSIPKSAIQAKYEPEEDISIYQRPYDTILKRLQQKVVLKMGTYSNPKNKLEKSILDLDKIKHKDTKRP